MKTTTRIKTLLAAALAAVGIAAMADIDYELRNGVLTISGSGSIPDYTTKYAPPWYLSRNSIKRVIIQPGVTSIGSYAFLNCSHLVSVTIPKSVVQMKQTLFSGCTSLKEIVVVEDNDVFYSVDGILFNKSNNRLCLCSEGKGGKVTIPANVPSIMDNAFARCTKVTTVMVLAVDPPSLSSATPFKDCPIEAIYVPKASVDKYKADNYWSTYAGKIVGFDWGVGENAYAVVEDGACTISGKGVASAFPSGFDRDSVTGVVVADGVTEIGERFFKKCRKLNAVTLGKDVAKVDANAFYLCRSLERIVAQNPAVVESLKDAVVYRTAFDSSGKLYVIPSISVPGYKEVLYGKKELTDPDWEKVDAGKTMEELGEEFGYHFFKHVLEKVAE